MKMIIRPMYLALFLTLTFLSCNNEELSEELLSEVIADESTPEDVSGTNGTELNTTPCDFKLDNVQANSTVIINCVMDLGGQTINLPANVTLIYEGGDIINGTLDFSSNTTISGELMNSSLTMTGSNPQVKDPTFTFDPKRWGIVEGIVSDQIALSNTNILEKIFFSVKSLGITQFKIDTMDAYFKVDGPLGAITGPETYAINLPSDFNLSMSNNTHIRMQPNGHFRAALLCIYDAKNVTVKGGVLHGDREKHNYNSNYTDSDGSTGKTHEWVDTMRIKGGQNIVIDGVVFQDATGDGLNISGIYHYYDSRHIKSSNIIIKNNKFLRARRTNLVITSGEQIFIENNELADGGIDMTNSKGIAPSSNLNFEPVRAFSSTGTLIEYERVSNIYIKNNKQMVTDKDANPRAGGFQISHGDGPIIIENNEMINTGVSFYTANGVIIRNNNIVQGGIGAGAAENFGRTDTVYGNEIYNNTVVTEGTAITVSGNGTTIRDNYFEGVVGASFGAGATEITMGVSNTIFKDNSIKAKNRAISTINTMKNVLIENNVIDMLSGAPFVMTLYNEWSETVSSNFIIKNNIFKGTKSGTERGAPPALIGTNTITFEGNKTGEIQITGGRNMIFSNNEIEAAIGQNGVLFYADAPNTKFQSNKITTYPSQTPLKINCIKVATNIQLSSVSFENQECIEK
ncbi:parallel beta helix pectate lyase-like protein [Mariniflexile fucanivorans]|uniref:Parallel beta helix pectate lyase-like protein n=2 Tax=Mariniflexile fucanivorans TaxID=264023 RepID=A0A4R1RH26_9FLAO|nr:right-handed parallel beta-helix repeat-containing protein [Mariniflexile fucanivorans]TCL65020.1 parallel beta helix pectate lyase-like protein [Mariniflexile fucanivorans]